MSSVAFSRIESRPRTVRPAHAGKARVLAFIRPNGDVLSLVEADCRALRIPAYDELKKNSAYWNAYNRYLLAQDWSSTNEARDRFWAAMAKEFRITPEAIKSFRESDPAYEHWLQCRENLFESAAYMTGLYIARREFPKLSGGVL